MKLLVWRTPLLSFLLACILLAWGSMAIAQHKATGGVKGIVKTSDGKPAENIVIILKGSRKGTVTDAAGAFEIKNVTAGTYELQATASGLTTVTVTVDVKQEMVVVSSLVLSETEGQLEEVVVTGAASKFAKKQSEYVARLPLNNLENPQVYTVVPKELFQEQVATDFKSALQAVPGVTNVTQGVGSGGIGLSIRLRGFSGANAGGAIRNGMATNFVSLSDAVNLESIEVIKGPSGALFGGQMISYGGLVNRVTKKAFDVARSEVSYSTGSQSLSRLTADINTPLNNDNTVLLRVNAAYHTDKSFQDFGRTSTYAFAPTLTYKVNDRLTLDVDFEMFRTKRNTTYIGSVATNGAVKAIGFGDLSKLDFKQSFTTNDLQSEAKIFNAFARATYKLSNNWTSQTNYSYANSDNNANYMFLALTTDSTFARRLMNIPSTFGVTQFQQNFIGDMKLGSMRNRLLVGLDYTQITTADRRTGQLSYDVVKFTEATPDLSMEKYQSMMAAATRSTNKRNFETYSAYVSDVLNITEALIAMASVRVDHYNSKLENYKQTLASPKLGLVYQLVKNKVSVFGNYMNGFTNTAPGNVYAYSADPAVKYAFKPEKADQLEGGVKVELLKGKLNGTLSYYDIKVKDKVRNDPEHANYSLQDGTQNSKGFEADLIANPFKGFHLIMGYGYNESKYTNADSSVNNLVPTAAPKHTGNIWASYAIPNGVLKGWGIGFGGNCQSESYFVNTRVRAATGAPYKNDAFTFMTPSFTRLDATLFYDYAKFRVSLKVNNLTNKEYWTTDAWAYREPTRNLIVNLTCKF